MTGISPLSQYHKKGIFGDHHKKNQSDLIKISEVKNLKIFHIFQYKKSNIQINSVNIDNVKFPEKSLQVECNKQTRILWSGPRTWFVISEMETISKIIKEKCKPEDFAITDISNSRAVIQIAGFNIKEILKKGCPININDLTKNSCAGTIFQGINVLIDMIDDKPEKFNLFVLRSFGESFYHDITDACLEDGYVGI